MPQRDERDGAADGHTSNVKHNLENPYNVKKNNIREKMTCVKK